MIIVTGGAGFIGSNLVAALNGAGREDIVVVDNLENGKKFINLEMNRITDYYDKTEFRSMIQSDRLPGDQIEVIFHQGACSKTTEWDGRYMLDNNFTYSKALLNYALARDIPFIYASSAAVYGVSKQFAEQQENERPVNVYGYSKLLFDHYVRRLIGTGTHQIAGLRYFNVYGPHEQHKDRMASVVWHLHHQLLESGKARLFKGSEGYADGEQRRDFVFVKDVVDVNLWLYENGISGIFNVGTGSSRSFNDVANAVISSHGNGEIEYIEFPETLKGSYQSFTEAEISRLRQAGYHKEFTTLEAGVAQYMHWLAERTDG